MNNRQRFEIRAIGRGWHYRPEKSIGTENEQGSLFTAFTNEPNVRQIIWSLIGPNYFKGFEPGEEVICTLEAVGEKGFRLIGIAGISQLNELGLPTIDPDRQIGPAVQPGPDSIIWDARKEVPDKEMMPIYYRCP